MDDIIKQLQEQENKTIIEVMAFMSYNPSIGRVMKKGSVNLFQELAIIIVNELENFSGDKDYFDKLHHTWIKIFQSSIETNKKINNKPSYGQAQKAINVFLKVYVYWAKLPDASITNKIIPFLHVPLDKILMENISKYYPEFYDNHIKPYKNYNFSLSKIKKDQYYKWQNFFREKFPERPILFDTIWAIERRTN